jgi:hypothetical protein
MGMMPGRYLREGFLTSEAVNRLDAAEERFYRRLMSVVDDFGRFDGRPAIVRAACFPLLLDKVREADVQRWMAACQKAGLIVLYEHETKPYLKLLNLGEPRAEKSKYPPHPGEIGSARTCAQMNADAPVLRIAPTVPVPTRGGSGRRESRKQRRDAVLAQIGGQDDTAVGDGGG